MKNIITITTDFGDQFAAAQLHAIIATYNFDGNIIENHSITPFSIEEGAFEIWQLSKFTPENTVHLGVVDPGVGSSRWGIIIKTKKGWYVGPDNGLLYPAATRDGITQVWKIKEESFGDISNTFHGRDVFVKAAVLLSQGKKPQDFECVNQMLRENLPFSTSYHVSLILSAACRHGKLNTLTLTMNYCEQFKLRPSWHDLFGAVG